MIAGLNISDLHENPWEQFDVWYQEALACNEISYPHAFTLTTLNPEGFPEGRIVLMKGRHDGSLVFYTNLNSNKGRSLRIYPRAGASFYWDPLGRQVRMYGNVHGVSEVEANEYFSSRSRESRIGAWASSQSETIASRQALEEQVTYYAELFRDKEVQRPPHWSGFKIIPQKIEFWQFREARLHDRFQYGLTDERQWEIERLQP